MLLVELKNRALFKVFEQEDDESNMVEGHFQFFIYFSDLNIYFGSFLTEESPPFFVLHDCRKFLVDLDLLLDYLQKVVEQNLNERRLLALVDDVDHQLLLDLLVDF